MKKHIPIITDEQERTLSVKRFLSLVLPDDITKLTHSSYSRSSELAMTTDWNRFVSFCEAKHVSALPTSITAVRLFLESESAKRKFSTLRRYSITISNIHQWHGFPSPTNHRQIRFTLQQLRLNKHGDATQASPMSSEHLVELDRLLSGNTTLRNIRDLSIYHVMFECALKRSELKNLTLDNVCYRENLTSLKIDSTEYVLSKAAEKALTRWTKFMTGSSGYLFRRIDRHGNIGLDKLDDSSIYRILRRASDLLDLPYQHRFTGQSARVGAAQELEKRGYNLRDIQDYGRWLSPAMPAQYLQKSNTAQGEMAKFKSIKPWD